MTRILLSAALAGATLLTAAPAAATVVTFESFAPETTYNSPLVSNGLTFTNAGAGGGVDAFYIIGPSGSANGTNVLVPNYFGSATTVTSTGVFTLASLQLADPFDFGDDPISVAFTFNTLTGTTTRNVALDMMPGMQTVNFNIAGITSFSFVASGSDFDENTVQVDNINYTLDAAGAVPEPATWGMMLIGFGLMGGAMRYRRRKAGVAFA